MAATDARPVPRKGVAYRVTFPIYDADGDLVTAAASLDSEFSRDAQTFADCTNEATEIAGSGGIYFLDLTASEMNGDTVAIIVKTGTAGAKTTPIILYPEELGDYRVDPDAIADKVWTTSVSLLSGVSDSFGGALAEVWDDVTNKLDAAVSSRLASSSYTAPDNASIAANGQGIASILTRLPANLIGGRMDSHVGSIADATISFGKFTQTYWDGLQGYVWTASVGQYAGVSDGTAGALADIWSRVDVNVSTRATPDQVWDEPITEHLNAGSTGAALNAAGAAGDPWSTALPGVYGAGTAGFIIGTNINATISSRLASASYTAPDNTTIVNNAAVLASLTARIPASLVGGRMDSHVGSVADGVLTLPKFSQTYFDAIQSYVWTASVGQYAGVSDGTAGALAEMWDDITNKLDVAVSTRLASASYTAPDNTSISTILSRVDVATSTRLASASYTAPDNANIALTSQGVASMLTRIPANLVNGRMDSHVGSIADNTISFGKFTQSYWDGVSSYVWTASVGQFSGVSDGFAGAVADIWSRSHYAGDVWDIQLSTHLQSGSTGFALNGAGSAGDPWTTALPGAYGAGTAGFIVGTNLNATVSSRLASASYTAPDNATIASSSAVLASLTTRIPASLVDGRIDAHIGSVADGVLTVPKFSQGYFDAVQSYVWTASVGQYSGVSDAFAGAIAEMWTKSHYAGDVWDITLAAHLAVGSTGLALNSAGSAGDPWNTALPGAYGAGTAGNILGTRLDVAVSTRLAAASYTAPPTAVQNADALLARNIAGGSNGGRDVTSALRILRNRFLRGVSTLTVYQEDDTTPAWTSSLTTDAAAAPVVQSDPA